MALQISTVLPHDKVGENSYIFGLTVFLVWTGSSHLQFRDHKEMFVVTLHVTLILELLVTKQTNK